MMKPSEDANALSSSTEIEAEIAEPTPTTKPKSMTPTPVLVSMAKDAWNRLTHKNQQADASPSSTASQSLAWVAAVAALAVAFTPIQDASAAMTGGRMGGSYPSAAPRTTISRPSSSSYSRGYSAGYASRPSVRISPSYGFGYNSFGYSPFASPFYSPFPRVYGGPGVLSVARGPSFFDIVFFGGLLLAVSNILSNSSSEASSWGEGGLEALADPRTSVVQVSVALEVPDRDDPNSILGVLDRLSKTSQTDSRVGISNLTSQVALALLRKKSSIVSANASTQAFSSRTKALRKFEERSVEERAKFETETVSKFGGVDYGSRWAPSQIGSASEPSGKATMAVVTLVLAMDSNQMGNSDKIKIRSISDVEDALRRIATDAKVGDCLQGAEILWTPEDRSETLTLRDVVADYPELRSV